MMPERPNTEAIALHDEVARAIRLQDEVAAEKAMRAIIDEAAAAVTEEFCGAEPSTSSPPSRRLAWIPRQIAEIGVCR